MPRPRPVPLSVYVQRFQKHKKPKQIMFCKRYKVEEIWDIRIGAVLDLRSHPHPHLVRICQGLFLEDPNWFIGDTIALMQYPIID